MAEIPVHMSELNTPGCLWGVNQDHWREGRMRCKGDACGTSESPAKTCQLYDYFHL